jgi:hypothetical protein
VRDTIQHTRRFGWHGCRSQRSKQSNSASFSRRGAHTRCAYDSAMFSHDKAFSLERSHLQTSSLASISAIYQTNTVARSFCSWEPFPGIRRIHRALPCTRQHALTSCSSIASLGFGLSTNFWFALISRLMVGLLNNNIATVKACVSDMTTGVHFALVQA